jgi:hypothetical protein
LFHRAAKATLKLVTAPGGEAFAGTAFSVLTPGGDVIREAIGAFPQVILAEGEYVLIARQGGQVHTHEFKIEAGLDRDITALVRSLPEAELVDPLLADFATAAERVQGYLATGERLAGEARALVAAVAEPSGLGRLRTSGDQR